MKKGNEKKKVLKFKKEKITITNSLPFRLLIIFIALLIILLLIYFIILAINNKEGKGSYKIFVPLDGSLGTIGLLPNDVEIIPGIFEVISFSLNNQDRDINVFIKRNIDNEYTQKINLVFNRVEEYGGICHYNITSNFPDMSETLEYPIDYLLTTCSNNFTGVTSIGIFAEVNYNNINLTQIQNIPNIQLNLNEYRLNTIDLDDYFDNLGINDPDISYSYSVSEPKFQIKNRSDFYSTHQIDFNASNHTGVYNAAITVSYPDISGVTSNRFNVSIINYNCTDSDGGQNYSINGTAINNTYGGTDYCYNSSMIYEYYCNNTVVTGYIIPCDELEYCYNGACHVNTSINRTPVFINSNCDISSFTWNNNTNLSFDLKTCFSDPDGDSLVYSFSNSNSKISLILNGSILTIIPKSGTSGSGYFYVYANDSIHRTDATINFQVNTAPITRPPVTTIINQSNISLRILNPIPENNIINNIYGANLSFSIANIVSNLDSIKWYLNNNLINNNSNSVIISSLSPGNHTLEVEIKKGIKVESYIWQVNIKEEEPQKKFAFDSGKVVLYVIFVVIIMIIIMIVWLFLQENDKKNKKPNLDLSSIDKKENNINKNSSTDFNIPR